MTIRTCLKLLALLSTLWPAGLIGVQLIHDRAENVAVEMQNLEEASNGIASGIDNRIQGTTQLLHRLARAKDLDIADKIACSSFLSNIREVYPQYTGILTTTPDGQPFCDSLLTDRTLDLRARGYFKQALVSKDRVVLEPVFGKLTGITILQMAYPVRSESGSVKFVLLASLNLENVDNQYLGEYPRANFEVGLANSKGTVLVGQPPEKWNNQIGTSIADTELFQFSLTLPDGGVRGVSGLDGTQQKWAFVGKPFLKSTGLNVMVGASRDHLFEEPNQGFYRRLRFVESLRTRSARFRATEKKRLPCLAASTRHSISISHFANFLPHPSSE